MKCFFDLEETIITEFDNPLVINIEKVKLLQDKLELPENISIFSFAIWDDNDRDRFNHIIKPMIESSFNFIVEDIPTIDEIIAVIKTKWPTILCREDFFEFFDKERAFIEFMRLTHPDESSMLIDDRVSDITFTFNNTTIKTVNINNI